MPKLYGQIAGDDSVVHRKYVDTATDAFRWAPVRAVAAEDIAFSGATPPVIDSTTIAIGDRILVNRRNSRHRNGIYVVAADAPSGYILRRAPDADAAEHFVHGKTVSVVPSAVVNGGVYSGATMVLSSPALTGTLGDSGQDVLFIANLPARLNGVYDADVGKTASAYVVTVPGLPPDAQNYTIRFTAPSGAEPGLPWQINGDDDEHEYAAAVVGGGSLPAGAFVMGDVVTAEVDPSSRKCFFKSGGAGASSALNVFWGTTPPASESDGIFIYTPPAPQRVIVDDNPLLTGSDGVWTPISDPPVAAANALIVAYGGYMYRVGGTIFDPDCFNAVFRYNIAADTWERGSDFPSTTAVAGGSTGASIHVIGSSSGYKLIVVNASPDYRNVYLCDLATGDWSTGLARPDDVNGFASAVQGSTLYALGGTAAPADPSWLYGGPYLSAYSVDTNTWTAMAPMPFGNLNGAAAVSGDYLFLLGGRYQGVAGDSASFENVTARMHALNLQTNVWEERALMPHAAIFGMTARAYDGMLYVTGGKIYDPDDHVIARYNTATDVWDWLAKTPVEFNAVVAMGDAEMICEMYNGHVVDQSLTVTPSAESLDALIPMPAYSDWLSIMIGSSHVIFGGLSRGTYQPVRDGIRISPGVGTYEALPALPHAIQDFYADLKDNAIALSSSTLLVTKPGPAADGTGSWLYTLDIGSKSWTAAMDVDAMEALFPIKGIDYRYAAHSNRLVIIGQIMMKDTLTSTGGVLWNNTTGSVAATLPVFPQELTPSMLSARGTIVAVYSPNLYIIPGQNDVGGPPDYFFSISLSSLTSWNVYAINDDEVKRNWFTAWLRPRVAINQYHLFMYPANSMVHDGTMARVGPVNNKIFEFHMGNRNFSTFAEVKNVRSGDAMGAATAIRLVGGTGMLPVGYEKYTFGTMTSQYPAGTVIVKTGAGPKVKLYDADDMTVYAGINKVYHSDGDVDVAARAAYNANNAGWTDL
jgi:hypothetical protein